MLKLVSKLYALESLAKSRVVSLKVYLILFFSYLLALLIPLLSITLFFNFYFTNILEEEILTGNETDLQQVMYMINSRMEQISIVRERIKSDETIKQIEPNEMPTKGLKLIQNLNEKIKALSFLEEAVVYFHEDSYAYSSHGSYSLQHLFTRYSINNLKEDQIYQLINTSKAPQINIAKDEFNNNFIVLMYPLPDFSTIAFNYNKYNKTLMFFIPESAYLDILKKRISINDQNTYIFDENGNQLVSAGNLKGLNINDFQSLSNVNTSNSKGTIILAGAEYFVTSVESDINNWKYVTLISANSIREKIVSSKYKYFWFIALILTLGLAVVLLLTTLNYRPIKRLKYKTRGLFPTAPEDCNEFEYVSNAIGNLVNENRSLQYDLIKQADITKDYLLFRLLKGDVKTIEEFNDTGKHIGISFSKKLYMVAIVHSAVITMDKASNCLLVSDIIKAYLPSSYDYFIKDHSGYNSIVAIISMDFYENAEIDNALFHVKEKLQQELGIEVTMGLGKQYTNLCEISKSYVEAMTAIDYRYIMENSRVIFYDKIEEQIPNPAIFPFTLGRLKASIIQCKKDDIHLLFSSLTECIRSEDTETFDAKKLCLGTMYYAVEYFNKLGDKNLLCEYSDVFQLSNFDKVDDFVNFIDRLCHNIKAALDQHSNPESNSVIIEMISYIKANYSLYDFSLQKMADQFNMPMSVVSQYFKDYTDMNIVDYLAELRIQKAKELLLNSDLAIKDISTEVGYYNVNSFIRRFKQIEGITPGDFRKEKIEGVSL